ncbi:6632_t:CDS:1 [Diversispora eburnea]|uniref:6632_t:CDS:1 n=1 Tax=Diversispora eburnea TaxID=1213867 RepID=A0A9N9AIM6_9GLOM|nr:6632_t:CDS:1 [Diversispora eburnea]
MTRNQWPRTRGRGKKVEFEKDSEDPSSIQPIISPNRPITRSSARLSINEEDSTREITRRNTRQNKSEKSEIYGETTSHVAKKLKTTTQLNSTDIDYIIPKFPPIQSKKRKRLPDQTDIQNQTDFPNPSYENSLTIIEQLEETNKILDSVRAKQQLLESNHNAENEKHEQYLREFKQFAEEKFQNYERIITQLQNQIQEEDGRKFKIDQVSMLERDLHKEREERRILEQDLKKEKEETRKLIDQLEQSKHELQQLQLIENSKNIGELKQKIKRLEHEFSQERENSKKLKKELDKIPITDTKQMEILAQLNLYQDLSNLLIQNVKFISQNEQSFTCILSGRNGSLVFKLTFNGDEYLYEPSINPDRDAELLNILPDYLREEISFEKDNLDLFFWRALNFLQKRESD